MTQDKTPDKIGAVIIGRNEGARLVAGLRAAADQVDCIVYVDSGSTDGSVQAAQDAGAVVVALDMTQPFTAARARNAGMARLLVADPDVAYVQFIDGDCELQPGWVERAKAFLEMQEDVAVTCGRRRERFPGASVYNRLIDQEWDTPVGQALACGGDALMRVAAFAEVGGYNPDLIAGEEPELCVRLRASGWKVWRLDAEMTLHDAALSRFSQWWMRNKRAGHAYAEGMALHGGAPEYHWVRETRSALIWGAVLPLIALLGMFLSPWSLALLLAWPVQVIRLGMRDCDWLRATFLTMGKLPEAQGVLAYFFNRLRRVRAGLIEYK
jgi:GT2 family glycosyltransferase